MRVRRGTVLLAAIVLAAAPVVGAVGFGVEDGPGTDPVPVAAHGDDHPPIRIHGDDQFLLPSSGVTGGSGTAEDPYRISGWTVRPLSVRGLEAEIDAFGEDCKPTPPVSASPWAPVLLHGIEIVDTSAHVVIENVTVVPREPRDVQDPGGAVDSRYMIGILLRDADHVTIRNVTVGSADGPRLYRGICAKNSDDLSVRDSRVQRTVLDAVLLEKLDGANIEGSILQDGSHNKAHGVDADQVDGLRVAGNRITDYDQKGAVLVESSPDALIEQNTVRRSKSIGIWVSGSDRVQVRDNVVTDHETGISVGGADGVEVHGNNIEDNTEFGVYAIDGAVDATHNWWGCPDGPTDADCDGVSGDVTYDPWLTSPNPGAGA